MEAVDESGRDVCFRHQEQGVSNSALDEMSPCDTDIQRGIC